MTVERVLRGRARWALVHGDARRVLASLPPDSVDHVITDPPYSRSLYSRTRTNKGTGMRKSGTPYAKSEGAAHTSALKLAGLAIGAVEDIIPWAAAELLRVPRRWVIVFHDCETEGWRQRFGNAYVRTGAWVKTDPMPQVSGDRPGQGFEPCTISHPRGGRMRWNGGGRAAVWRHGTAKGLERRGNPHPCPKPLALMRDLVEQFTNVGDLVIDPFAGSGSTGVACLQLGRRFIGVEKDARFAKYATYRLKTAL